ncbi:MAG: LamG domain-containing protein, partial [Acidobacteriota bacterium]
MVTDLPVWPGQPLFNLTDESFTIATWVKPESVPSGNCQSEPKTCQYGIVVRRNSVVLTYESDKTFSASAGSKNVRSAAQFEPGSWHHVMMSVDDSNKTLTLFVDGKQEGSVSFDALRPAQMYENYSIGHLEGRGLFQGNIDDVRLYKRSLSASEAAALFQNNIAAPRAAAQVQWSFSPDQTLNEISVKTQYGSGGQLGQESAYLKGGIESRSVILQDVEPNQAYNIRLVTKTAGGSESVGGSTAFTTLAEGKTSPARLAIFAPLPQSIVGPGQLEVRYAALGDTSEVDHIH